MGSRFGQPNDEGLPSHPLWPLGLSDVIQAGVVENSDWLAQVENMVFQGEDRSLKHHLLVFKDAFLECIASGYVVQTHTSLEVAWTEAIRLVTVG